MIDKTYYDEHTLPHVVETLRSAGFSTAESNNIINSLFNAGILFRERVPNDD